MDYQQSLKNIENSINFILPISEDDGIFFYFENNMMKYQFGSAKEVGKLLTLAYNKKRQGVITAEVSEITGGIEALKEA